MRTQQDALVVDKVTTDYISICQYSNMAPELSGQTSIFSGIFFVSKSLLGFEEQMELN